MPRVVRGHAAVPDPMRPVLLHEQGPLGEPGATVQGMGHGMDRERERRLHRERLTPECFGPAIITVLRASECGHGEQIFVAGHAGSPRWPHQLRDLAQRPPAAEKEMTRLGQPQRQEVPRPLAQDRGVALRGKLRLPIEPGARGSEMSALLLRRLDYRLPERTPRSGAESAACSDALRRRQPKRAARVP